MRGTDNRTPLLAAIFMALLLATIPGTAQAQLSFPPATANQTANNCTGLPTVAQCQCLANNAQMQRAQAKTISNLKVYSNAQIPSMKFLYCWNSVIMPIFQALGLITAAANNTNAAGAAIWAFIVNTIILPILQSIANQICADISQIVNGLVSYIKNLICIPIPHFNLNLGGISFKGGSCSGMNLFNLLSIVASRPQTPTNWNPWGWTPPGAPGGLP